MAFGLNMKVTLLVALAAFILSMMVKTKILFLAKLLSCKINGRQCMYTGYIHWLILLNRCRVKLLFALGF